MGLFIIPLLDQKLLQISGVKGVNEV